MYPLPSFFEGKTTTSLLVAGIKPDPTFVGFLFYTACTSRDVVPGSASKKGDSDGTTGSKSKPHTMESYTSHLSEAAQKNQKKEDAVDTISKSVACGRCAVGTGETVRFIQDVFNYFLTARFGHKSFQL
ncbi:MAG: hypothetical protein CMH47_02765 [Muricauda sp.]|nr:hypothetical protein [Allomuricauda sp.]